MAVTRGIVANHLQIELAKSNNSDINSLLSSHTSLWPGRAPSTESAKSTKTSASKQKPQPLMGLNIKIQMCKFCSKNHQSLDCMEVRDPADRFQIFKNQGLCTRCSRRGHLWKDCDSGIMCNIGTCINEPLSWRRHHNSLHEYFTKFMPRQRP